MDNFGFIVGIIVVYLITLVLKRIIKQPRPSSISDDYGMPSSTLAVVTFSVIYICFVSKKYWIIGALIILSTVYLKLHLHHHTPSQIVVGGVIGILVAALMYFYGIRASITLMIFCISRVYTLLRSSKPINFDLDDWYVSDASFFPLQRT